MSPITHFLVSWSIADSFKLNRRERLAVTLAGALPDADGLGIVVEYLTRNTATPLLWFENYHRILGHNLFFGLALTALAVAMAKRRWFVGVLALAVFHLHLVCDVIGGRGPDGSTWPIQYLWPVSAEPRLMWSGAWSLNAWQNFLATAIATYLVLYRAWRRGYSPVGIVSERADRAFIETLRRRFPLPKNLADSDRPPPH